MPYDSIRCINGKTRIVNRKRVCCSEYGSISKISDKNDNGRSTNNVVKVVKIPTIKINKPIKTIIKLRIVGRGIKEIIGVLSIIYHLYRLTDDTEDLLNKQHLKSDIDNS